MKVKVEMEDREALQMVTMLTAIQIELEEKGNQNNLLAGSLEALKHSIFKALIDQVPLDRVNQITKK